MPSKTVRMAAVWGALGIALLGCASKFVVDEGIDSGPIVVPVPDVGSPDVGPGPTPDAGLEADAPPGRVTDGLVAFMAFQEDGGTTVHDTAPAGNRLELAVARVPAPDGDGGSLPVATSGPTVAWISPGMSVVGRVLVASTATASTIESRCNASNEITVEAWVKPANTSQGGPARIVTMSGSGNVPDRNFMLGQSGDHYVFRVRHGDAGVVEKESNGGVALALTHVAVTARATGQLTFWVNGVPTAHTFPAGAFGFQPYRLALANEIEGFTAERLWRGDYRLVAVYCRALSEAEIRQNRELGPNP